MTTFQVIALTMTAMSCLGVFAGWAWIMMLTGWRGGEVYFGNIKQAWRSGEYAKLAPVLVPMVSLFFLIFAVAGLMFAFDAPFLLSVIWLAACFYAAIQTLRAFAQT